MHPVAVIGLALGVGLIVYAISLRGPDESLVHQQGREAPSRRTSWWRFRRRPRAVGFTVGASAPLPAEPEPVEQLTYVPIAADGLTWRTRVTGLVGLVMLIALAAAVVAGAVYEVGHLINETIAKFLGK
jgi:hypothetical protein